MSKKFGINSKSAEARARKDVIKQSNERDKQEKLENEYWRDDDKHVQKKEQRKNNQEQKEHEKLQRKQESQKQLEQEEAVVNASKTKAKAKAKGDLLAKKVSQAQIEEQETTVKNIVQNEQTKFVDKEFPLEENLNHLQIDCASARNVDDAINVFQSSEMLIDRHPEKRLKAAFDAYENEHLPKLKEENPSLRLSQLKELLKKKWIKAPENPFNKATMAYNQSSYSKQSRLTEEKDSDEEEN